MSGNAPWDGVTMGEVQVRGSFITGSYHQVAVTDEKFTPDGWLRTGDVATMDALGFLRIIDRTKGLIKSGGEWISSVDLENALMAHPAVAEAAIIATPAWPNGATGPLRGHLRRAAHVHRQVLETEIARDVSALTAVSVGGPCGRFML